MKILYSTLFLLLNLCSFSQTPINSVKDLLSSMDTLRAQLPIEKLYIHFDKSEYTIGDTIWFKAYLFEGTYLTESQKSGLFYVELVNNDTKTIERTMLPLRYGLSWGNISLDEEKYTQGNYTIRAYTNWMRNWGEEAAFTKNIYIAAPSKESWLVNLNTKSSKVSGKTNVSLALQLNQLDKQALDLRELKLSILEGQKSLFNQNVKTTANGEVEINFTVPDKADLNKLTLIAEDLIKNEKPRKLNMPLFINGLENTDLQFMPEGGHLVAGLKSRVGFKAIGEDGKGIQIEGNILDSKKQEVLSFKTFYKGMGSFEFTPQANETYSAQLTLKDGTTKNYTFPSTQALGTVLSINNEMGGDSLIIKLATNDNHSTSNYYLIGQARGVICYAKAISFKEEEITNYVPKSIFPSGIVRFSLLNNNFQPLNERITYINHQDNLKLSLIADKSSFQTRDSISLNLLVKDKEGKPIQGSFSLSVTDDNQNKTNLKGNTITTYLQLTSELKGTVEDPNYYTDMSPESQQALDNLLLTQGWTGYDWKDLFNPKTPEHVAESEFTINGRATSTFRGIPNTKVILYSPKPFLIIDTLTDQKGYFSFKNLPLADTASYLIQAYNRNGKSFIVDVEIDKWNPPVFAETVSRLKPWFLNIDSSLLQKMKKTIAIKEEELGSDHLLSEVIITGKRRINNSFNLNGPGESDQVIEEKDFIKDDKTTLLDILFKQVNGFKVGASFPKGGLRYSVNSKRLKVIIDGVDIEQVYGYYQPINEEMIEEEGPNELYQFMKDNLEHFRAKDIKGIELMYNDKYTSNYNSKYLSTKELMTANSTAKGATDYAYLEITTHSGQGPFMKNKQGVSVYKPMSFSLPKQFYRPRYPVKETISTLTDLRSTLHWAPNIFTDEEGKAQISFYASDEKTSYSVIVEGSDMNGNTGSLLERNFITINPLD